MKPILISAAFAALFAGGMASAQTPSPAPPSMKPPLVSERLGGGQVGKNLKITSADFRDQGKIPLDDTSYGASRSPPLVIKGAPKGVQSFVILMEDTDAVYENTLVLHWFAYNLPAATTSIPGGLPAGAHIDTPVSLDQGLNVRKINAYFGPHPPAGKAHRYHVEVFGLNEMLPAGLADRDALVSAMTGHVLASGELLGTFAKPAS